MATNDKFAVTMKNKTTAEITLYDVIDSFWGVSAAGIYDALKAAKDEIKTIRVRINSPGGNVFEGTAIYNLLRSHSAKKIILIDGIAASMASVVAMAGDEIHMGEGAYMMIHDPLGRINGGADEMRDMADLLEKMKDQIVNIYARRTGQPEDTIREWMADETWMTADQAIENKFADRTVQGLQIAAIAPIACFSNVPEALTRQPQNEGVSPMADNAEPKAPAAATYAELKAACVGADAEFICAQMESAATVENAVKAWMGELTKRADAANTAATEAKAEAEKVKAQKSGVEPLGSGSSPSTPPSDPVAEWRDAIKEKVAEGLSKGKAVAAVVRENPDLHAAYIEAVNANR